MDFGIHLPLVEFGEEGLSLQRLECTAAAAVDSGFAALSANDHFLFQTPWLDGPTALASVISRSADLDLATTVFLPVLRGPVPLAKALTAIDVLSEGRVIAGVGPGSSPRDYAALGVPFEERWQRFDEALKSLRTLLRGDPHPEGARYPSIPSDLRLEPGARRPDGIPLWIASWGAKAGLARVAKFGDGWLASAYNTTPARFGEALGRLQRELEGRGRSAGGFPNALVTMWTWVCDRRGERDRALSGVLAPMLGRDPRELGEQVCVGPPEHCADLLSRYAEAGCRRVYLWPLGDERRQLEALGEYVLPLL